MEQEKLRSNITSTSQWLRGIYMLLSVIAVQIAQFVLSFLVIIQFVFSLVTGQSNPRLAQLGHQLNLYVFQILQFLTYNSEEKAFPFRDWPNSTADLKPYTTSDKVD